MRVYCTIQYVFEYYAIIAAVLIFGLNNEEQHILTFYFLISRIYINTPVKHSIILLHQ